jgi:hypothetical protein
VGSGNQPAKGNDEITVDAERGRMHAESVAVLHPWFLGLQRPWVTVSPVLLDQPFPSVRERLLDQGTVRLVNMSDAGGETAVMTETIGISRLSRG